MLHGMYVKITFLLSTSCFGSSSHFQGVL